MTFVQAYKQAMELSEAIPSVIPDSGDLHQKFHMLDTIYRYFYGGFLQVFHWMLGWKHLNGSDVTKTCQNCRKLAILVYEEVDRIMREAHATEWLEEETTILGDTTTTDEIEVAIKLSEAYPIFITREIKTLRDWRRRWLCNFILLMRKYLFFSESERVGDAPMQELITSQFLSAFHGAKKFKVVGVLLRLME